VVTNIQARNLPFIGKPLALFWDAAEIVFAATLG